MAIEMHYRYSFGPFSIDTEERLLLREGKHVPLKQKAVETLTLLLRESPRVVEKDRFMQEVWPDAFVEEGSLTVNISELRKALGGNSADKRYIETIPRRGYRFVAEVKRVCRSDERPEAENDARARITFKEEIVAATEPIRTLAVLPFVNVNSDPALDYLADGVTESIINSLSQLSPLRVLARSTVFRFKGREIDPQQIGRELGVRALLLGRVIQLEDKLVVSTELVDTTDGAQLWGEQYNRRPSDLMLVQDEISSEVVERLRLHLTGEERRRATRRYTDNIEAYHAYLKGRYYWNKRTEEELKKGIRHFQQAIEIEPTYALAYTGLSDCYIVLANFSLLPAHDFFPKARAAAMKALEIDDALAEAHCSLGTVRWMYEWDRREGEREYKRALELNPNYATAHHWYSFSLAANCRMAEALAEIERAYEIDPLSLIITTNVGTVFYWARRYDRAIEMYLKALEIDPSLWVTHWMIGLAFKQVGRLQEAVAELIKAAKFSEGNPLPTAALGHAYAVAGMKDKARKVLKDLQSFARQRYVPSYAIGKIYAGLGDEDLAFEHFQSASDERDIWLSFIKIDPEVDHLRSDPRFVDLVRRVGLAS